MARKRKRNQWIKPTFKLISLDGLGIKYIEAHTLGTACWLAGWDAARVDYEIFLPTGKNNEPDPDQKPLPGIEK